MKGKMKSASLFLLALVLCSCATIKEQHERQRRLHQIDDVGLACRMYADKHGGNFPCELRDLSEIYRKSPSFFARALAELELAEPCAHITNDPNAVLILERSADANGQCVFGYFDGHTKIDMAKVMSRDEVLKFAKQYVHKTLPGYKIVDEHTQVKFNPNYWDPIWTGPAWEINFEVRQDGGGFSSSVYICIKPNGAIENVSFMSV